MTQEPLVLQNPLNPTTEDQKNPITVLTVDDEPEIRTVLRELLEDSGASVLEASSGGEALEILSQQNVNVVISDLRMPGIDGVTLLKAIRARFGEQPIFIFCTGLKGHGLQNVQEMGAYEAIAKPFDPQSMIQVVKSAIAEATQGHAIPELNSSPKNPANANKKSE
jgi:CheY-like chemotaxis protein